MRLIFAFWGRARGPIGPDQGAVEVDVGVPGHARGQQRAMRSRCRRGEHVDGLVQEAVGRGRAEPIVGGELGDPGAVEKPAQHHDRLPVAAQRAAASPGPATDPLSGEQAGQERDGGSPSRGYVRHDRPDRSPLTAGTHVTGYVAAHPPARHGHRIRDGDDDKAERGAIVAGGAGHAAPLPPPGMPGSAWRPGRSRTVASGPPVRM
jgi:hypothetical protein